MADAVPVCDVLCEAMEYLSKLGSNLRVRSENLKEKRLRKEKLRNVHAVQKAASKVLLICELSKKSIQNVETGVKNILTQIDASQAPIDFAGKNIEKPIDSKNYVKYKYFQHESHNLKIRDNVNIKHFTSVKVLVKPMSTIMQDKYPVYEECKLYHMRRKKQNNNKEPDLNDSSKLNSNLLNSQEKDVTIDSSTNSSLHEINDSQKSVDTISKNKHTETERDNHDKSDSEVEIKKKTCVIGRSKKKYKFKGLDSSDSDRETNKEQENNIDSNVDFNKPDNNESNSNKAANDNTLNAKNAVTPIPNERKTDEGNALIDAGGSKGGFDHFIEKEQDNMFKTMEFNDSLFIMEDITEEPNVLDKDSQNTSNEKVLQSVLEKNPIENSSQSTSIEKEQNLEKTNDNCDENMRPTVEMIEENSQQSEGESNTGTSRLVSNIIFESENSQGSLSSSKSFIKCVNINKLLRTDKIPKLNQSLIEITDSDSDKEKESNVNKNSYKDKYDKNKSKSKRRHNRESVGSAKHINKKDAEEYWKLKRKEVEAFKPRNFVINVTKLPKLTPEYLKTHQLKKITQNGLVVCEIPNDAENDNISQEKTNLRASTDISSIKNTLLNESDSDKGEKLIKPHKDSDSKKSSKDNENCSQPSSNPDSQHAKPAVNINRRKSTQSTSELLDKKLDNNEIKSSLLHDSTDDSTPTKKRKRHSEEMSSPLSKRKHIMESMHAKKMLLTYSSSSDTDDENLRNALKEIRDTLLKGNSSDEEIAIKKEAEVDNSSEIQGAPEPNKSKNDTEDSSAKDTNSQIDENSEENSNTCSEKVRSVKLLY